MGGGCRPLFLAGEQGGCYATSQVKCALIDYEVIVTDTVLL